MNQATLQLTIGRLYCGALRNYLEGEKFKGSDIEFIESKGWLSRQFVIKGGRDTMIELDKRLTAWIKRINDE